MTVTCEICGEPTLLGICRDCTKRTDKLLKDLKDNEISEHRNPTVSHVLANTGDSNVHRNEVKEK